MSERKSGKGWGARLDYVRDGVESRLRKRREGVVETREKQWCFRRKRSDDAYWARTCGLNASAESRLCLQEEVATMIAEKPSLTEPRA